MAGSALHAQHAPLEVAPARAIRPGDEALDIALAQLRFGEAFQLGILGDTGCGKSTATKRVIARYLRESPGSVLVVDDKEMSTTFVGQMRRDVHDLAERPIDWQLGRVTILRGDVAHGERVNLDEVAAVSWARVGKRRKTLNVWDELIAGREETVAKNGQWRKGIKHLPSCFTMGRSPGISNVWGAQSPQDVPKDPFEQASAILCFRLAGLGLQRLRERDYLEGGADAVIPRLPGPPLPPDQRGEFVLLVRGQPWNGERYKFDVRRAAA